MNLKTQFFWGEECREGNRRELAGNQHRWDGGRWSNNNVTKNKREKESWCNPISFRNWDGEGDEGEAQVGSILPDQVFETYVLGASTVIDAIKR